jgi:predicted nucleic acid-binding protein
MIDPKKLPASMLIDTTVALRGFGAGDADEHSPICLELVDACIQQGTSLLIAAPTLAEILRGGATKPVPRVHGVEVVAFDEPAARKLDAFSADFLKSFSTEEGLRLTYIKYDALIVACAARYKVAYLVSLDQKQRRFAIKAGVNAVTPEHFLENQLPLFPGSGL